MLDDGVECFWEKPGPGFTWSSADEWARTEGDTDKLALLMSFETDAPTLDVPDPYYAGPGMFDDVLTMIEGASRALFRQLEPAIRPAS